MATTLCLLSLTGTGTAGPTTQRSLVFSGGVTAAGGNLSVPANLPGFTVTVPAAQDALIEAPETVILTVGTLSASGGITDDDVQSIGTLTAPAVAVDEGGSLVYTVNLSAPSPTATTYNISYTGTADAADHTGQTTYNNGVTEAAGVLTIPGGTSNFTVTVPVTDDAAVEAGETPDRHGGHRQRHRQHQRQRCAGSRHCAIGRGRRSHCR